VPAREEERNVLFRLPQTGEFIKWSTFQIKYIFMLIKNLNRTLSHFLVNITRNKSRKNKFTKGEMHDSYSSINVVMNVK
jgi:hypothetical protein